MYEGPAAVLANVLACLRGPHLVVNCRVACALDCTYRGREAQEDTRKTRQASGHRRWQNQIFHALDYSEINFDETPYWAVLPDVGQFMEKVKKSEREPANPQPLRLKACLETCFSLNAIEGGPGDDPLKATDVVTECFACGMGDALATCPFCLLTYHHRCVVDMAKHFECHDVSATMEPLHSVVLPGRYFNASYMCALCASSQDVLDIEGD